MKPFSINILCLLLLIFPGWVNAQQAGPNGIIRCLTTEKEAAYRAQYPGLETEAEFEAWLQARMAERERSAPSERAIVTIPVVVHVIHNGEPVGTGLNISQAQVQSQIEVLNEDFRRIPGTPGHNSHPDGADTEIEFCLAAVDPSGAILSEPGIHRVNSQAMGFAPSPYSDNYVDINIKPVTYWDPEQYMNIWVCRLDSMVLGFAKWPFGSTLAGVNGPFPSPEIDGVVIRYTSFGRVGNLAAPYNKGRSATHEIGHFFGLRHIWGDGGCGVDDFCADTPESDDGNYGCPLGHNSCGSGDMVENYMDYTDDICMNIFTSCQKSRMLTVLNNSPRRIELVNSNVCTVQMTPPSPDFISDLREGCPGLQVRFSDASTNGATSWEWTFQGGSPGSSTQQNPTVKYNSAGTFNVTLKATNGFGSNTTTKNGYITIDASGLQTFYLEDFESTNLQWTTVNPDNDKTWEQVSGFSGSQNGNSAVRVNMYLYETKGQRDGLVSPVIDLTGKTDVRLQFDHAYRPYPNSASDSLIIYVSTDGGASFPHRVFAMAEDGTENFATNTPTSVGFDPANDEDWCYDGMSGAGCFTVGLNAFDGEKDFVLKFETYNDYGNNLYVDNIALVGGCSPVSVDPNLLPKPEVILYPNPNSGQFGLELSGDLTKGAELLIWDVTGRPVWSKSIPPTGDIRKENISLNSAAPGTYILMVKTDQGISTQKFIVTNR